MRKIMLCAAAGLSAALLFGCGKAGTAPAPVQPQATVEASGEDTTGIEDKDSREETIEIEENEKPGTQEQQTPAKVLLDDFLKRSEAVNSMEDLANELAANEIIPFAGAVMPVEPGFLNGFTDEIDGFAEGASFGPMIGSIPFVGYVFQVDQDVDAFVENLKKKSDLRWNVCTQADEMICEAKGNKVFFVMAPADFEE